MSCTQLLGQKTIVLDQLSQSATASHLLCLVPYHFHTVIQRNLQNSTSMPQLCSGDSEKGQCPNLGQGVIGAPPRPKREGEIRGTELRPLATYTYLENFPLGLNFISSGFVFNNELTEFVLLYNAFIIPCTLYTIDSFILLLLSTYCMPSIHKGDIEKKSRNDMCP